MNKNAKYWSARVNKLSVGNSVNIPDYGRVTYYAKTAYGRRFKLVGSRNHGIMPSGNLSYKTVKSDIFGIFG